MKKISKKMQIYIILYNCKFKVRNFEDVLKFDLEVVDFYKIIKLYFADYIKIENDNHLSVYKTDYWAYCGTNSMKYDNWSIDIYGASGIYDFIKLAKINSWQIFDTGLEVFIDYDYIEKHNYTEYREYVISKINDEK